MSEDLYIKESSQVIWCWSDIGFWGITGGGRQKSLWSGGLKN